MRGGREEEGAGDEVKVGWKTRYVGGEVRQTEKDLLQKSVELSKSLCVCARESLRLPVSATTVSLHSVVYSSSQNLYIFITIIHLLSPSLSNTPLTFLSISI